MVPSLAKAGVIAAITAFAATPASAAILFQQTVDPVAGVASFEHDWLSNAPGTFWIGVAGGQLASAHARIDADYTGLFWDEVPDYSPAGSHPELFAENYSASPQCNTAIGSGYCASPFFGKPVLITRMSGAVFEVEWKGLLPFDNCQPFDGNYFVRCAAYDFQYGAATYRLDASADQPVTFTIYDANPTGAAVPEPASWALLFAGFGLVGGMLRRCRVQAASRA